MLNNDFGEVFIVFIVDVDDLDGHSDDLLEGLIETHCVVTVLARNGQHLECLVEFAFPPEGDHHLVGGETVVQHL